jgi:hypothetical protein
MSSRTKSTVNKSEKDHFSLHAEIDQSIVGLKEHSCCVFSITPSKQKLLNSLNPAMAQHIVECEDNFACIKDFGALVESLAEPTIQATNSSSSVVSELHAVYGMTILLSYSPTKNRSRKFIFDLLNHIHKDRQLLASIVGSAFVLQSTCVSTKFEEDNFYLALREPNDSSKFITIDTSFLPKVIFPHINLWHECGLGWLFGDYVCSKCYRSYSTPWKEHNCR